MGHDVSLLADGMGKIYSFFREEFHVFDLHYEVVQIETTIVRVKQFPQLAIQTLAQFYWKGRIKT